MGNRASDQTWCGAMIRVLNYLGKHRDRWMLGIAGVLGFGVILGVIEIAAAYTASLFSLSTLLPAVAGALLSMGLTGWARASRSMRMLNKHNNQLGIALNNMIQGLCMFDGQNRLVVWNERYRSMYNIDPRRIWAGCGIRDLLDARKAAGTFPHNPATYEAELRAAIDQGKTFTLNIELKDGRIIAVINAPTKDGGWVATHEDITERKRAERELEHTRSFLDTIIENVPSPIVVKELPDLRYVLVNRAAETFLGTKRDTMLGKTVADVMPKSAAETVEAEDRKLIEVGKAVFFDEHAFVTPGNGTRVITSTRLPVMGPDGKPQYVLSVFRDVTERKRNEQRIAHMTHHDSLTDLPNRAAFNSCIAATLELAAVSGESFAVLNIDLDRFKAVNDVFGHAVGDALLREVARRMETACQGAFLARVGGDEFIAITPTAPQPAAAEVLGF
jgi:PAS domain S-box-containing protein